MGTTVTSLWVGNGPSLGPVERLCIQSYLDHGHTFELYTYDHIYQVPAGTIIKDASEILPKGYIFMDSKRRSYELFSDWWRMKWLFERGGFWTDMDIVCLSDSLPRAKPWYAAQGDGVVAVGALSFDPGHKVTEWLMKAAEDPTVQFPWDPPSEIEAKIKLAMEEPELCNRRLVTPWGYCGPNEFSKALKHYDLYKLAAHPSTIYPVHYTCTEALFTGAMQLDDPTFRYAWGLHLWGSCIRECRHWWNNMASNSAVAQLCKRHRIEPTKYAV